MRQIKYEPYCETVFIVMLTTASACATIPNETLLDCKARVNNGIGLVAVAFATVLGVVLVTNGHSDFVATD